MERAFFERNPDVVARDLIGVLMTVRRPEGPVTVRIVETEAYGGEDDEASHAYRGRTTRNGVMFGPAGHLYVYLIYGVHWCMNVVTRGDTEASAVLLRAAELVTPIGVGLRATSSRDVAAMLRGPGNLTKALGVTGVDDGIDCCRVKSRVIFRRASEGWEGTVSRSTRIGISRGQGRLSRYFLDSHPAVSRAPRHRSD